MRLRLRLRVRVRLRVRAGGLACSPGGFAAGAGDGWPVAGRDGAYGESEGDGEGEGEG